MITKNFKALMALMWTSNGNYAAPGLLPVRHPNGGTSYVSSRIQYWPASVMTGMSFTRDNPGIQIGTGTTAPTEDDYKLESLITSGITASSPTITRALDASGNPYIEYVFLLTNTTAADITVSEVGYVQYAYTSATEGASATQTGALMFDRTVLSAPITVPANGTAALKYTLKTVIA